MTHQLVLLALDLDLDPDHNLDLDQLQVEDHLVKLLPQQQLVPAHAGYVQVARVSEHLQPPVQEQMPPSMSMGRQQPQSLLHSPGHVSHAEPKPACQRQRGALRVWRSS
ncbi:hypothetical protein B0H13DRAFT_1888770 [Mycena leptocephala]|nr:hypothetical protein B0H13DRAFT_1888770 [Mycena leptocephala]